MTDEATVETTEATETAETTEAKPLGKTKVRCIVTGQIMSCRPDVFAKRVEKAGSEEAMRANYISASAKRAIRDGQTIDQIREGNEEEGLVPSDEIQHLADAIVEATKKPEKAPEAEVDAGAEPEDGPEVDADDEVAEFLADASSDASDVS